MIEATSDCSFNSPGHYLFIESSSPRMLNDTARLFSPVYAPPEAPLSCFTFWYHMYGSTTGESFQRMPIVLRRRLGVVFVCAKSLAINSGSSIDGRTKWKAAFRIVQPRHSPKSRIFHGSWKPTCERVIFSRAFRIGLSSL